MILGHVTLDGAFASRRVTADGAASRTACNVAFLVPLKVPLHRRLVSALGTREHRLAGMSRPMRAPLDATVGDKPRAVRTSVDQPSGVACFHV